MLIVMYSFTLWFNYYHSNKTAFVKLLLNEKPKNLKQCSMRIFTE